MANVISEGAQAPDFDLATVQGGRTRLADFKGRPLVLYFYPKDDTPGCTKQALAFTHMKSAFDAIGAAIVGVSPDSPQTHEKFIEGQGLTIVLASDESKETLQDYGVWAEKSMYGKKYMGVERTTFLIDANGAIVRVWRKVKAPGHAEEVLAAATKL